MTDWRAWHEGYDDPASALSLRLIAEAGLDRLEVACADAGETSSYAGATPADLLLLCGVFGNIDDDDIRTTVENAPALCAPGATVVWTRHRRAPDLTPAIRGWWADVGFEEVAFVSPGPASPSVGVCRLSVEPLPFADRHLFTFC